MSVCPSCGAEIPVGNAPGAPCPSCGRTAPAVPDLDLAVPPPPPPKPRAAPKKKKEEEERIDFAIDLSSIRPSAPAAAPVSEHRPVAAPQASGVDVMPVVQAAAIAPPRAASQPLALDPTLEARTLANYGEAPSNALFAPLYAYRVWKRRNELRVALAARRDEAAQAARALEDAMCALGERVRAIAAGDPQASRSLQALRDAEELLRARDATLAREQDAHRERIVANDARIAAIETELVAAKGEERAASQELADAVAAVQRAEAKMKRADIELRNLAAAQAARKTGA